MRSKNRRGQEKAGFVGRYEKKGSPFACAALKGFPEIDWRAIVGGNNESNVEGGRETRERSSGFKRRRF